MQEITPVARLSRDLRKAAETLSDQEARYLVDAYYQMQKDRIRSALRIKTIERDASGEPHAVLSWLGDQSSTLEQQIKGALDRYSSAHPVGAWMKSIKGVGPVISAGYLANCDITRLKTAGSMWAHCGVAPGKDRRVKGEKMPYNGSLKRLTFLVGESFKRLSSDDEDAYYRHVYDVRKAYEARKNEAGDYAEQAALALTQKRFGEETQARAHYQAGRLPPARIDLRACRYAAKLFLAHLHQVWWRHEFGEDPANPYPLPYAIAHLNHAHVINPPT